MPATVNGRTLKQWMAAVDAPRLTHDEWNHDADPTPARTRRLNDLWINADTAGKHEVTILIVAYTEGRI